MKQKDKTANGSHFFWISAILAVSFFPDQAEAYIGPGAGFAVAGSFLVMFFAMLSAIIAFITWPIRGIVRAIRFRRIFSKSRFKKMIIIGLDGMDYTLTRQWLSEGKLPNLGRLRDQGCFKPLLSTIPPISPVAWSSFQTGTNPGKSNIFDFLTRDPRSYAIKLSSVDIKPPARKIKLGKYQIPLGSPDIRLLRKSVPFWKLLGERGIFSSVIRVPITFPAEKFYGIQLSGMCAPDLRGTQGTFSFFTSEPEQNGDSTGGEVHHVAMEKNIVRSELLGPQQGSGNNHEPLTCRFEIAVTGSDKATLKIDGSQYALTKGKYSEWIKVEFKSSPFATISGICKFLLISTNPEFKLYVTPIHINPEKPAMPISYPLVYSTYLSKRQGYYATLGLIEDSWALNKKLISDDEFFQQCLDADKEREEMFLDSLDKIRHGLCICVFDGTDRVQHAFWRQIDESHPANNGKFIASKTTAIEEMYRNADMFLGKILKRYGGGKDTLIMVISDHGFNGFRYGVDLNRWLEENGYLKLKDGSRNQKNLAGVDWTETRAFALGLSGIFLNIRGRESKGIVDPKTEAPLLREEIAEKLRRLHDPIRNQPAVKQIYNSHKVYRGPYINNAPDLIIGYQAGYRASWETAVGQVTEQIFHDNVKAWSGDHCIDHSLVPGVLFCSHEIKDEEPRLMDIGPTVLNLFGVEVPAHMDGRQLTVLDGKRA